MGSEKQYIDLYKSGREALFGHSAAALNAVRDKAFDDFCRLGFPTRKVEKYKYTLNFNPKMWLPVEIDTID